MLLSNPVLGMIRPDAGFYANHPLAVLRPAGSWLPTCWVVGEVAFASDRWLTRWNDGQWQFTHHENVRSVTPLQPGP